jgi:prephenate dehydrogenase
MNIGVIGLGLIGGSFALAAKQRLEDVILYGADQNKAHLEEAIESGIVDQSLSPELYTKMDVMILAIPVNAASLLVLNLLDQINDNALGSTKV